MTDPVLPSSLSHVIVTYLAQICSRFVSPPFSFSDNRFEMTFDPIVWSDNIVVILEGKRQSTSSKHQLHLWQPPFPQAVSRGTWWMMVLSRYWSWSESKVMMTVVETELEDWLYDTSHPSLFRVESTGGVMVVLCSFGSLLEGDGRVTA